MGVEIHLPAAAAGRLDHPEQSGGLHVGDVLVRQSAQRVGFDGALAQDRSECAGGGNRRRRIRRADRCRLRVHPARLEGFGFMRNRWREP